jgi:uncharacterized protein YjhX (UPF0386 family)
MVTRHELGHAFSNTLNNAAGKKVISVKCYWKSAKKIPGLQVYTIEKISHSNNIIHVNVAVLRI